MKWLKLGTSGLLLTLSLPVYRLQDWAVVVFPSTNLITTLLILWFSFFLLLPLKLLFPKINIWIHLGLIVILGTLSSIYGPLTRQATLEPKLTHCGYLTYTGMVYPLRSLLSSSYQDDIEAKNQLCWLVKMIKNAPAAVPAEDLAGHLNVLTKKLEKPAQKYRSSVPWIAVLLGKYISSTNDSSSTVGNFQNGKLFLTTLKFWQEQYGEEISARKYSPWEWPFSNYIQFEYGLIEKNLDHFQLEDYQ